MKPDPYLPERFEPAMSQILRSTGQHESYVYIDGYFVNGTNASISVWDHGLLYGDGVFEGIRAYDGRVFKLDEHLDRLYRSAAAIGLCVPLAKDELAEAVCLTFSVNGLDAGHARPIVTRGVGLSGLDPRRAVRPSVVIMALALGSAQGAEPIRVCISSVRRRSSRSVDSSIKCLNYMDSILARLEANAAGVDDALMLDLDGHIAEATAANVFVVKGEAVATPTTAAALPGITRGLVIAHLAGQGVAVAEREISVEEVLGADEVFLTGTAAEIVPVGHVDGHLVGKGERGSLTMAVSEWYGRYARTYPGHKILMPNER